MAGKVVVFGSFVVDLTSRSRGLPVPGQTLLGSSFKLGPGGKGSNQAVAAHRAGADVIFITKIGKDVFGRVILDFYRQEKMNTDYIIEDEAQTTGAALIMVDEISGQNMITVTSGACGRITPADVARASAVVRDADVLLLQLEVNMDATEEIAAIAHAWGKKIVLNTAPAQPVSDKLLSCVSIVTPNETEAEVLTGIAVETAADARRAAEVFLRKGLQGVVITLGAKGAFVTDGQKYELLDPIKMKQVVDTTGAGDAFNGGFAMALAEGHDLFTAAKYGNVAGALSVTQYGTAPAMPVRAEIDRLFSQTYLK
ncbi:MAG TPA: ribokinase [Clostridiales bacterium]|nr:ribokinase [Clostridiales bacterium]